MNVTFHFSQNIIDDFITNQNDLGQTQIAVRETCVQGSIILGTNVQGTEHKRNKCSWIKQAGYLRVGRKGTRVMNYSTETFRAVHTYDSSGVRYLKTGVHTSNCYIVLC